MSLSDTENLGSPIDGMSTPGGFVRVGQLARYRKKHTVLILSLRRWWGTQILARVRWPDGVAMAVDAADLRPIDIVTALGTLEGEL